MAASAAERDAFLAAFHGSLIGLLRWSQFEALINKLVEDATAWYIYVPGEPSPQQPTGKEDFRTFSANLVRQLRPWSGDDRCGFVYADDIEHPSLVKVYRPDRVGCGIAASPPLPGWVFSRLKPVELIEPEKLPIWRRFKPWGDTPSQRPQAEAGIGKTLRKRSLKPGK